MENLPEITFYFKVGIIGMAEEVTQTIDIKYDDNLSDEENERNLALKAQVAQIRMQASLMELMMEKLPAYLEQLAKDQEKDAE